MHNKLQRPSSGQMFGLEICRKTSTVQEVEWHQKSQLKFEQTDEAMHWHEQGPACAHYRSIA